MNYEIEFLPVGDKSRPGDAIVIRYGEADNYELMLVDGGHEETGEQVVSHLYEHFGKNVRLAHVVLTHSDSDHASGLRVVLDKVPVSNLWLHIPWDHAENTLRLFKDARFITADGLSRAIRKEYDIISDIVDLANAQGTSISEPFHGEEIGRFTVLSPSKFAYEYLLPQFDKTPDPNQEAIEAKRMWLAKMPRRNLFERAVAAVRNWIPESWGGEQLKDGAITSASNETSVVLYGTFDKARVLLTGDAGVNALTWAAKNAASAQLPLQDFSFVQIPHHGSRSNVGPTILNTLLGAPRAEGSKPTYNAFVSSPKVDATHPRKMVLNAFARRGAKVVATRGRKTLVNSGFPSRNYEDAVPEPFAAQVEAYD